MLNEIFAREILETSIALGILQEMNGGIVIYHEASKEDPENLPAGWYIDDKDYTTFSIANDPEAVKCLKAPLKKGGYNFEERKEFWDSFFDFKAPKLLTALYDEVLDTDTDAEGMWPTEELATPVEEYSLIFGCREASELIYFAEGMRKRALYSAIGAASLALKRWNEAGINIKTSLEEVLNTIPMGSTEAYTLSCATDILCNTPCPEANELFYNGYRWSCCPNDFELDDIIKHPEQYIVVPVLFAEQ